MKIFRTICWMAAMAVGVASRAQEARLANLSIRATAGGNEPLVTGFTIGPGPDKTVLIRAVGPALGAFGVSVPLADPKLELYRARTKIAENDNFNPDDAAAFASVGAIGMAAGSKDAAILVDVPPGNYHVRLTDSSAGGGEVLVEIYDVTVDGILPPIAAQAHTAPADRGSPATFVAAAAVPNHSADTDLDFRLSLQELARVIELDNTRNGPTRTGFYKVRAGSEDGFAGDPTVLTTVTKTTLSSYHSADSNRDGRIDPPELVRVIQLYNFRSGTLRTGAYHVWATGVFDGSAITIYVNGVAGSRATNVPVLPAAIDVPLSIGQAMSPSGDGSGSKFDGAVAQARFWDVARTADQIRAGMAQGRPSDATGLMAYLSGGNDGTNVLITYDATSYADYARSRSVVAVDRATLLPIAPTSYSDGRSYALNPNVRKLKALFDQGKVAFLGNVGTLVRPTTLADYNAGIALPNQLYSHLDQTVQWQSSLPDQPNFKTGWGGRMADIVSYLNTSPSVSMSLDGANYFGVGKDIVPYRVNAGGYDHHNAQVTAHANALDDVSSAMAAFYDATVELGLADKITTFTASDFGRTYVPNTDGTDHGWGNIQWIMGGAVRGGDIYGRMPSLQVGGPDDTGRGRWIPSTSVDEYNATLARWFGVSDTNLPLVLPNIGRFAKRDLGFMG